MTRQAEPPFRRNRSHVITITADTVQGACALEVKREEWRSAKTGRYSTVWCAREPGRLGWEASGDLRTALKRAAHVGDRRRPQWLTDAVRAARAQLDPTSRRSTREHRRR